jgi:hypothetical protein
VLLYHHYVVGMHAVARFHILQGVNYNASMHGSMHFNYAVASMYSFSWGFFEKLIINNTCSEIVM